MSTVLSRLEKTHHLLGVPLLNAPTTFIIGGVAAATCFAMSTAAWRVLTTTATTTTAATTTIARATPAWGTCHPFGPSNDPVPLPTTKRFIARIRLDGWNADDPRAMTIPVVSFDIRCPTVTDPVRTWRCHRRRRHRPCFGVTAMDDQPAHRRLSPTTTAAATTTTTA